MESLANQIKSWGKELGFATVKITDIDVKVHKETLKRWLAQGMHGDMEYMANNQELRLDPAKLHLNTKRVIVVTMNYLPANANIINIISDPTMGYVSRYATGKDYHKFMRKRLKLLGDKINKEVKTSFRPFVDSAPVLERHLAQKAGVGWIGKHSLILNATGSMFFLGEIFVDLELPIDNPIDNQCGKCVACIKICPTNAIVAPYIVDSRKCISYLTIENKGSIPVDMRELIGNRIYGCDDCQLICQFNQIVTFSTEENFNLNPRFTTLDLLDALSWDEEQFKTFTLGSAIGRIGHLSWQRNVAVALGNAPYKEDIVKALRIKIELIKDPMVLEHMKWALSQQLSKQLNKLNRIDKNTCQTKLKRLVRYITHSNIN